MGFGHSWKDDTREVKGGSHPFTTLTTAWIDRWSARPQSSRGSFSGSGPLSSKGNSAGFNLQMTEDEACEVARVMLNKIPASTEKYLLDFVWSNYLANFPFVNKQIFLKAKQEKDPKYYCLSLHLCLLMHGVRLADWANPNLQPLIDDHELIYKLYIIVRRLVDEELETSKAQPLMHALLLPGAVEGELGCFHLGAMHIGKHAFAASHPVPQSESFRVFPKFSCSGCHCWYTLTDIAIKTWQPNWQPNLALASIAPTLSCRRSTIIYVSMLYIIAWF